MSAFTGSPLNAPLYARQVGTLKADALEVEGGLCVADYLYTHLAANGAGTGEINLLVLPPGHLRIYSKLSYILTSPFATSSTLDLGYRAYTDYLGATQVEDDNAFVDNANTAGGAVSAAFALPAALYLDVNTAAGLHIFASVDSGNIETDDTIWVQIVYARLK